MPTPDADRRLIQGLADAYRAGIFPMADPRTGRIDWYCPDPRAVIPLSPAGLHVSRSLARRVRRRTFRLTADACFERVMRECAKPRELHDETWIDERLIHAYTAMHHAGLAHSIETWLDRPHLPPELVGGIYGVSLGGAFFAESMFSRPALGGTDASKVALLSLWNHLRTRGYRLLDVQFLSPHLASLGAVELRRSTFLKQLQQAGKAPVTWGTFNPDAVLTPPAPDPQSADAPESAEPPPASTERTL